MSTLTTFLGNGSTLIATFTAVSAAASAGLSKIAASTEASKLDKSKEDEVLRSTDINKLGEYLYNNVGRARISSYVRDENVRDRVARTLETIIDFLGTEEVKVDAATTPPSQVNVGMSSTDDEMQKALNDIRHGEVWNGLSRLRRHIEMQLRRVLPNIAEGRRLSAGQLLNNLTRTELISAQGAAMLRHAINVANAGIHGEDIDPSQAEDAWLNAVAGLAMLSPESPTNGA
jgi:hypothetical protein